MTAIYLSLKNINAEVVVGGQQQQETSHLIFVCACSTTFTTFTGGNKISQDKNTRYHRHWRSGKNKHQYGLGPRIIIGNQADSRV